jgi:hypothetical protein
LRPLPWAEAAADFARIARTVHRLISAARDRVLDHTRDDYDPVRAARLLAKRLKDE